MAILSKAPAYSSEQYLALERKAAHKSEYINGRILAMGGASRQHNQITFNLSIALGVQLKGRACVAYSSDMRVTAQQTGLYTYPDIVATCEEPQFEDTSVDTLLNPALIIEVLSESTEAYDRGGKFAHYRRIPALKEYILISQSAICVEHYLRQDERWLFTEICDPAATLILDAIDCRLSITDIYDKVEIIDT